MDKTELLTAKIVAKRAGVIQSLLCYHVAQKNIPQASLTDGRLRRYYSPAEADQIVAFFASRPVKQKELTN